MDLIIPDWPLLPESVGMISTTRKGGVSLDPYDDGAGDGGLNLGVHVGDLPEHVERNRRRLQVLLPTEPAWLTQVHGVRVLDAAGVADAPEADASISTHSRTVCVVQTADCLPVLFSDLHGRVVGAAHAGWRGLARGVLQNTVNAMRSTGAAEITAWLGPAIGPQNFEVGQDVFDAFVALDPRMAQAFQPGAAGKYLADIYLLARLILKGAGVHDVFGGGRCTVSEKDSFYSFRRDRVTGRMASLIWLK